MLLCIEEAEMRVTIELPDELRAAVMALSARRGYRGYGRLIVEAVEHYLAEVENRETGLARLLEMRGSWSRADADKIRTRIAETRANYGKRSKR
jgi:metal-responsive CopG/Arc/MetJ family transcriptional regulator